MTTAWIEEIVQTKGDLPGHPFRGNQWSGGGGSFADHDVYDPSSESYTHATRSQYVESIMKEGLRKSDGIYGKAIYLGVSEDVVNTGRQFADTLLHVRMKEGSKAVEASGMRDFYKLAEAAGAPDDTDDPGSYFVKAGIDAVRVKKSDGDFMVVFNPDSIVKISAEPIKSPSRLAILHKLLDISTKAVRLKQLLLKDQLRNAVVKAVHLKQYAETEAEPTDAMEGLIKRQFADAGRKLSKTKDELELIEKHLPGQHDQSTHGHGGGKDDSVEGSDPTQTPEFKAWFGNSKVVDADGKPLVVYHGTTQEFTVFTKTNDLGYHFGTQQQAEYFLDEDDSTLISAYVSIKNPLRLEDGDWVDPSTVAQAIAHIDKDGRAKKASEEFEKLDKEYPPGDARRRPMFERMYGVMQEVIKSAGYDGVVYKNTGEESVPGRSDDSWIAFHSSQIKRTTNRTFTVDELDISKSFKSFSSKIFDPRSWDDDLINTALPILMKKAGEAAAAQMLLMGVDVAPRKKVGRTEKGDLPGHPFRGNQWSGGSGETTAQFRQRQQESPEFKAWFGDSKVVDTAGKPLIVYHGTTKKFNKFRPGESIFCSSDPVVAARYAGDERGGNIIPVYLSIRNPATMQQYKELGEDEVKRLGYDGVIPTTGTMYIVFQGTQVKSAIANSGIFDSNNLDIRKSPSFASTKTTATDWLLENADVAGDLLWPEVFTLPSGAVVDMGFATEWPDWMKTEISKQMKETFEQPFWAGINDTTAKGIQAHVEKGLLDGLSIREIQKEMVGDGLNEYYHNRGINIARTESGSALNGARSAAMDRLAEEVPGLKVKRTWMSVLGTTTRDTHAHLDGVPADRDGLWYLGGVRVPWPGHWNLPAGERCNCQCTLTTSWGQSDEAASELIEEYNQRLNEERSLRDQLIEKGDLPGHPFRGNQWSGGGVTLKAGDDPFKLKSVVDFMESIGDSENEQEIGNALTRGDLTKYVIESDGKLVGAVGYSVNKGIASIHHMGSLQKGIGTQLLRHVQAGRSKVIAKDVIDSARGFYEKMGFRPGRFGGNDMVWESGKSPSHLDLKGDKPGHPFRGNQWGQGRGGAESGSQDDYGITEALDVLTGKQPPNAATSVRKIDQTSIKSDNPLGKGGVNVSRVVEIEDADGTVAKYCFKPDDGEDPRVHPAHRSHQSVNEVASSIVDEAMGLGMVAKTEMAEIGGKKGSLQKWVNDSAELAVDMVEWNDEGTIKTRDRLDGAKGISDMMHFDAITGNTDRHMGNYLVKDGKVKLIDNGMSMAVNFEYGDEALRYRTMEHAGSARAMKKMSPKFKAGLNKMLANKDEVDAKLKAAGMHERNRDSFWKRAEYLQRAKMLGFGDSTLRDLGRLAEGKQLF